MKVHLHVALDIYRQKARPLQKKKVGTSRADMFRKLKDRSPAEMQESHHCPKSALKVEHFIDGYPINIFSDDVNSITVFFLSHIIDQLLHLSAQNQQRYRMKSTWIGIIRVKSYSMQKIVPKWPPIFVLCKMPSLSLFICPKNDILRSTNVQVWREPYIQILLVVRYYSEKLRSEVPPLPP